MSVDQIIFFVLITHEIALDTRLYVIVFLFLLPCNTTYHVACRNAKQYVQYVSSYICYYFILVAVVREISRFRNESMYQGRVFI